MGTDKISDIEKTKDKKQSKLVDTTVYIVGDSTVCVYDEDEEYAIPRAGWGMFLDEYLTDSVSVEDLALSGRSSKSFTKEENYNVLWDNIKSGDYLMIQFGHNDEKNEKKEDIENRYTDPLGDKESEGSFKKYLYEYYIKPAEEVKAQVILITPVARRRFDNEDRILDSHGRWSVAVRELAEELDLPLIDLSNISLDYYNDLGIKDTKILHSAYYDTEKGDNGLDNTHFSYYGALEMSKLVARELGNTTSSLKEYLDNRKVKKDMNRYITYGKYVYGIMRVLNKNNDSAESYVDEKKDMTYRGMVDKAEFLDVINSDKFMSDNLLDKQGMLKLTERALDILGYDIDTIDILCDIKSEIATRKRITEKVAAAIIIRLYSIINGEGSRFTLED